MLVKSAFAALIGASAVFAAAPIAAQQASAVAIASDVLVERVVKGPDGTSRTEQVAADRVVPGDRLVFRTTYRNDAGKEARDFVITNPLHPAVQLAPDAAESLTVSVDKGQTWGKLADLVVPSPSGGTRPAERDDITHIRWTLGVIAPGQTGERAFAAIVR